MKHTQLINLIATLMIAILFLSCSSDTKKDENNNETEGTEMPTIEVVQLNFNPNQLPSFSIKGEVVGGIRWKDANGENYFIVTHSEEEGYNEEYDTYYGSEFGWGYHYANKNSEKFELLAEFHDFVKECEYDLVFNIHTEALNVTDLDENGFGEVAVVYEKTCTSDVSPIELKLILFENGNKYVIRGNTIVYVPDKLGGDMTVDKSFDNALPILREHSIELFKKRQ